MRNVANAGRHFVAFLLAPGTPQPLRPLVNAIVNGYSGATLRIDELLGLVRQLVRDYSSGSYLGRETTSQTGSLQLLFFLYCNFARFFQVQCRDCDKVTNVPLPISIHRKHTFDFEPTMDGHEF